MKKQSKTGLIWIWLTIIVILIDIGTKYFVNSEMELGQSVQVFPFLNIALAHNVGAAFNLLSNQAGWQQWLFGMIALLVSIFIFVWLWRLPRKAHWSGAALSLVLAGALGNLYDRLVYGYVVDYIDFHVGNWHWPSFNVADSAIVIGVIILILEAIFRRDKK